MEPYIYTIGFGIISGLGAYIMRMLTSRLERVEKKLESAASKEEVRQLLEDKLDPIQDDIQDIKASIKLLTELFYSEVKK